MSELRPLIPVYVVMGNDFPDCAFSTNEYAEAYCEKKRREDLERRALNGGSKIYWRVYPFAVDLHVSTKEKETK